ncbi:type II toxin-antitoxin system RelE/ParE family toxin [Dyella sp. LX-66]|uniref:type II toxin-antitoxin system RelE/ParE family toxin n=1 Tax=unclassified Dyella TaxID=2634549 RepID=UPI001BE11056|nr:type II toxin-antitoxin system RelE/ParE family toxin [Dyella sp. LX-1]MBT2140560.1 type II toxin-antitoxin system RelE/ParE family toxin [Dyella sp. LX-66]
MTYRVRFTEEAREDLLRCFDALLGRDRSAAERALAAVAKATELLKDFPYACRKADESDPFLRELLIGFGEAGYVALFEIHGSEVHVLAVRHQHEDDYY